MNSSQTWGGEVPFQSQSNISKMSKIHSIHAHSQHLQGTACSCDYNLWNPRECAVQKHGLNQVRDFHIFCLKRVGLVLRCLKKHCNISQALPFPNFHFLVSPHLFHLFHRLSFLSASSWLSFHTPASLPSLTNYLH